MIYTVEVTVSDHDSLQQGITERPWDPDDPDCPTWHRVAVAAHTDHEAVLLASQMASCTGGMCTSAVLVDWPQEET